MRLYAEGDRIAALVANSLRIRLLFFDPEGRRLEEQVLLDLPLINVGSSRRFMAHDAAPRPLPLRRVPQIEPVSEPNVRRHHWPPSSAYDGSGL